MTLSFQVSSDEEAVNLMNDSSYGLTASVWTNIERNPESEKVFLRFVDELETGTVFLNRCDGTSILYNVIVDRFLQM
jgi:acyl-CoA reductase-like NAD-dependent aldehyde dehydrogenase